jgi:addiction module RelE/StbE family toxin
VQIRFTRLALADLREAEAYLRARDPTAAAPVMRRLEAAIRRLEVFPESGRRGRVAGTREVVVPETPFVVAYRPTTRSIDILAVVHGARRWPSSLSDR